MIENIAGSVSQNGDESAARSIAFHIEAAVCNLHNYETDRRAYLDKIKSLTYNLKINEVCIRICISKSLIYIDLQANLMSSVAQTGGAGGLSAAQCIGAHDIQ